MKCEVDILTLASPHLRHMCILLPVAVERVTESPAAVAAAAADAVKSAAAAQNEVEAAVEVAGHSEEDEVAWLLQQVQLGEAGPEAL